MLLLLALHTVTVRMVVMGFDKASSIAATINLGLLLGRRLVCLHLSAEQMSLH